VLHSYHIDIISQLFSALVVVKDSMALLQNVCSVGFCSNIKLIYF